MDVSDLTNAHYRPVHHLCGGALGARIDGRLIIFENIAPRADAKSPVTAARGWVSGCGWMGRSVCRLVRVPNIKNENLFTSINTRVGSDDVD